jgi:hypothetical protein
LVVEKIFSRIEKPENKRRKYTDRIYMLAKEKIESSLLLIKNPNKLWFTWGFL